MPVPVLWCFCNLTRGKLHKGFSIIHHHPATNVLLFLPPNYINIDEIHLCSVLCSDESNGNRKTGWLDFERCTCGRPIFYAIHIWYVLMMWPQNNIVYVHKCTENLEADGRKVQQTLLLSHIGPESRLFAVKFSSAETGMGVTSRP